MLVVALAVTLPVAAAYRLTAKGSATELIAYTFAGLTSPQGIDNDEGLEDIRAKVAANGSETVKLGGVEVVFTAEDVDTLSPRGLRLKVFGTFAESLYDHGAKGLAESQGLDAASAEKIEKDAALVNLFSADAHRKVGTILFWLVCADILLLAGMIYFSRRFGRLASPGLVLLLTGLPGLVFAALAAQNPEVSGTARVEDPTSQLAIIGLFASFVAPLVVPHFAAVYLVVLISGASLLLLAGAGKVAHWLITRSSSKRDEPGPQDNPDSKKGT